MTFSYRLLHMDTQCICQPEKNLHLSVFWGKWMPLRGLNKGWGSIGTNGEKDSKEPELSACHDDDDDDDGKPKIV